MWIAEAGEFRITNDVSRFDLEAVHDYLCNRSYWAEGIPFDVFLRSVENALCFGVFQGDKQVGFCRVVTDKATFAYIGDVFVLEEYRGNGLSKWLMEVVSEHPELQGLRRTILATADAHGLYAQFGFTPLGRPDRWMEKHDPLVYYKE